MLYNLTPVKNDAFTVLIFNEILMRLARGITI